MKKLLLPLAVIAIIGVAVASSYFIGQKRFWTAVDAIRAGDTPLEYAMDDAVPENAVVFYSKLIDKGVDILPSYVGRARAYRRMKQEELSQKDLDTAVALDSASAIPIKTEIQFLQEEEMYDEAVAVARQLMIANPGNVEAKAMYAQTEQSRGEDLYMKNDFNAAIESFTQSLRNSTQERADWYLWRAAAYVLRSIPDAALRDLESAERIDPAVGGLHFWRGRAQKMLGRYEDAITSFNKILEANPSDAETIGFVADIYLEKGDYEEAEILCHRVVQSLGETLEAAGAYACMGRVNLKKGIPKQASQFFRKAVELNPADMSSYFGLTAAYAGAGDEQSAEQVCREAMRHVEDGGDQSVQGETLNMAIRSLVNAGLGVPENAFFPLALGRLYLIAGQPDMAIGPLTAAVNLDGRSADAYYYRGQALFQTGSETEALRDFDNAQSLNPTDTRIIVMQGVINRRNNNYGAAIQNFRNALENKPGDSEILRMLSRTLVHVDDYEGAMKRLDQWIAADPEAIEPLYLKGVVARRAGNRDEAIKSFSAAASRCPDDERKALIMNNVGIVYFDMGEFDNAQLAFDTAARLDALNPTHPLLEGSALLELGRSREALEEFQNAINISSEMIRISDAGNAGFHKYLLEQSRRVLPAAQYGVAAASVQIGENVQAVAFLKKAQASGFRDINRARSDRLIDPIRGMSGVDDILIGILRNSEKQVKDIKPLAESYEEDVFSGK